MQQDGLRDDHTKEGGHDEKDIYHMLSLLCGFYHITEVTLPMKEKQTHRHGEQTCGCQAEGGVGNELGVWD